MKIGNFRDGALVLSCGVDGAASDLVFAEGAMNGDPALSKQRAILDHIVLLEKDAERYRLLRRGQHWSVVDGIGDTLRADALDAAIDAVTEDTSNAEVSGAGTASAGLPGSM